MWEAPKRADERPWSGLAEKLGGVQIAALQNGRQVWSSGLSVQGFGQPAYQRLLDLSGSLLEVVQTVGQRRGGRVS